MTVTALEKLLSDNGRCRLLNSIGLSLNAITLKNVTDFPALVVTTVGTGDTFVGSVPRQACIGSVSPLRMQMPS